MNLTGGYEMDLVIQKLKDTLREVQKKKVSLRKSIQGIEHFYTGQEYILKRLIADFEILFRNLK